MKKNLPCQHQSKESWSRVTISILGKADFRIKEVIKDKEGLYIVIQRSIFQEDISTFNIYAFNNRASRYMK